MFRRKRRYSFHERGKELSAAKSVFLFQAPTVYSMSDNRKTYVVMAKVEHFKIAECVEWNIWAFQLFYPLVVGNDVDIK